MIIGLGTDLCEIDRIEAAIARTGERFLARVFTPREQEAARAAEHPIRAFARFFAIKESTFKTLRRGWPYGVGFVEVELETPSLSCGAVRLSGRAADLARSLGICHVIAAATSDHEIAAAVALAEGRP